MSTHSRKVRYVADSFVVVVLLLAWVNLGSASALAQSDCDDLQPDADLVECDFSGQNLSRVDLSGATVWGADFRDANLSRAVLRDLRADNPDFDTFWSGANLSRADLSDAALGDNIMNDVNLSRVIAQDTQWESASLDGANLSRANLQGGFFFEASLEDANFSGADLRDANLVGADVSGAVFDRVRWGNTRCPDGSNSDDSDGDDFTCLSNLEG